MAQTRLPFCSPYRLFVALIGAPHTPAEQIHRGYALFVWRNMAIQHMLLVASLTLLWPAAFVVMAFMFTRKIGPGVAAATGKSVARQLREQLWLALAYSIPPDKYYVFELFRDERRAQANDYILRYELKGGFHNMTHARVRATPGMVNTKGQLTDKLAFSRRCRQAGVDAPVILAYLDAGQALISESHQDAGLPKGNIFIKPSRGKGGRGCERWSYRDGLYRGPENRALTESGLLRHIADLAKQRGRYLIQECLENHPDMSDLGSSLTSLRITSCQNESANVEVTNAVLKMSLAAGASVDNFHQGGAVAKVDVPTGRVGRASDSWSRRPTVWHTTHPITKAPIEGRVLPYWSETVGMVERAHGLFPDRAMLGFDVAITSRGPVIIEGNVQQGCDMIQRTDDVPVGKQRLGQILAWHATRTAGIKQHKRFRWFGPQDQFRKR